MKRANHVCGTNVYSFKLISMKLYTHFHCQKLCLALVQLFHREVMTCKLDFEKYGNNICEANMVGPFYASPRFITQQGPNSAKEIVCLAHVHLVVIMCMKFQ